MDAKEHFLHDDATRGPADVRTALGDVDYFFLGNGLLQAIIQVCRSLPGTPLGLILQDPDKLAGKRQALTFDARKGLARTQMLIRCGNERLAPDAAGLEARWNELDAVPQVDVTWHTGVFAVRETFFLPDQSTPLLARRVRVHNRSGQVHRVVLETALRGLPTRKKMILGIGEEKTALLLYRIRGGRKAVVSWSDESYLLPTAETIQYWRVANRLTFSEPLLNHLWKSAKTQLAAIPSRRGVMGGVIWQPDRARVRDLALAAQALTLSGRLETSQAILDRLLAEHVTLGAEVIVTGGRRQAADDELEIPGCLLQAVETYCQWSGDFAWAQSHWPRITALADFPFGRDYLHAESGLLHGCGEYWGRHAAIGIEDGFELMQQLSVGKGIEAAARLAKILGEDECSTRWSERAAKLKKTVLQDRHYRLVDHGHFIKRRRLDGTVQEEIHLERPGDFPNGIPLKERGPHLLNPDASSILPIADGLIDRGDPLARRSLTEMEALWNQRWTDGGYGRYHASSEPDTPGAWPSASLFIARAHFQCGDDAKVWRVLRWLEEIPGGRAGSYFEFYGSRQLTSFPQAGITPGAWAELILFFMRHILGVNPGDPEPGRIRIRPRLLSGLDEVKADLNVLGGRLRISLQRIRKSEKQAVIISGKRQPFFADGLVIPVPERHIELDFYLHGGFSAPKARE